MGQQFPNFQNPQFLQGLANAQQQQGMAAPPGAQGGVNPLQALSQHIPGIDPRMMNQAQQEVANPNAGDALNIFPGPLEMALGGVGGLATAAGISALMEQGNKGPFDGWIPTAAKRLDELPLVRKASNFFNNHYKTKIENKALNEALFTSILKDVTKNSSQAEIDAAVQKAVRQMEGRHVEKTLAKFPNRFNDNLRAYYQNTFLKDFEKNGLKGYQDRLEETFKQRVNSLSTDSPDYQKDYNKLKSDKQLREVTDKNIFNFAEKTAPNQTNPKLPQSFDQAMSQAKAQMRYLEKLEEGGTKLSKEQKQILERLKGAKERMNGLKGHFKPSYEAQARLTAQMAKNEVGPLGRTVALAGQYLQRIFNGDTMSMGNRGKGFLSSAMMGPLLAGALIFGQSIKKARDSEDDQKVKIFFHDFFGSGIANFIGWEFGRKWLNSTGIAHKALGKFGTKRPFDNAMGRWMPVFGEKFGKTVGNPIVKTFGQNWFTKGVRTVLGTGLGGLMSRLTLGGLATELAAMFVFGSAFQWVGEKVSHGIFGRPSKDAIDGKKPNQPGLPGQPQQPGMSPTGPMAMGFNPNGPQAATPQGMGQPGMGAQGPQPQGLQQRAFGQQGPIPATTAGNPAMAYGQAQPGMPANPYGQPPQPQVPQVPVVPPDNQRFSISPAAVSQSSAASGEQQVYQQILNAQKSDQQKVNGRNNFFNPNMPSDNTGL